MSIENQDVVKEIKRVEPKKETSNVDLIREAFAHKEQQIEDAIKEENPIFDFSNSDQAVEFLVESGNRMDFEKHLKIEAQAIERVWEEKKLSSVLRMRKLKNATNNLLRSLRVKVRLSTRKQDEIVFSAYSDIMLLVSGFDDDSVNDLEETVINSGSIEAFRKTIQADLFSFKSEEFCQTLENIMKQRSKWRRLLRLA